MSCGVRRLVADGARVTRIELGSGEVVTAETIISSAGLLETMRLCEPAPPPSEQPPAGRLSFVETTAVLDRRPESFGHDATIVFFNDAPRFDYQRPDGLVDLRSGVFCCPTNYVGHEDIPEGIARLTWIANYDEWATLNERDYSAAKGRLLADFNKRLGSFMPDAAAHIVCTDMFTPVTIHRFTGHLGGAVYGSPQKSRDGRTPLANLFVCGTDQGYLGIIGAMLSGITIANLHVLSAD